MFKKSEPEKQSRNEPPTTYPHAIDLIYQIMDFVENDFYGRRALAISKGDSYFTHTTELFSLWPDELRTAILLIRLRKLLSD